MKGGPRAKTIRLFLCGDNELGLGFLSLSLSILHSVDGLCPAASFASLSLLRLFARQKLSQSLDIKKEKQRKRKAYREKSYLWLAGMNFRRLQKLDELFPRAIYILIYMYAEIYLARYYANARA